MVCVHEPESGRAGPPVQDLWLFSTALKKGSLLARTQIEETQDSPADLVRHGFCAPKHAQMIVSVGLVPMIFGSKLRDEMA